MIFESIYLRVLNRISRLTGKIDIRARALIVFLCFAAVGWTFSLDPKSVYDARRMVIISLLVMVVTFACAEGELKSVRWNIPSALMIELFGLSMIIIRPIHSVGQGYMVFAFDILILFPMLYTVLLNKIDKTKYFDLMSYAVVVTGILCFALSIILAQGGEIYVVDGRVAGAAKNPNYYGMVGLALTMSGIYFIANEHKHIFWKVIAAVSAGIGLSMIIVSVSRTALLSAASCFVVFIVFAVRKIKTPSDNNDHSFVKKLPLSALFVLLIILSAAAAVMLQQTVFSDTQKTDKKTSGSVPIISIGYEAYAEDGNGDMPEEPQTTIKDRLSTDTDLNSFSSGRIVLWKIYIERFNLTGNDYDAEVKTGIFSHIRESRAHNNFIDYSFRFGIPAGLLYTLFYISVLINAVRTAFLSKRFTACDMWVVMAAIVYALYAVFEISTLPFTRYMPCLFFLSAATLMGKPDDDSTDCV